MDGVPLVEPMSLLYNALLHTAASGIFPYIWLKARNDPEFRKGRRGIYNRALSEHAHPRIWLHASSVGEVTGALPVLHALHARLPRASLFLTVGTLQGFSFAGSQVPPSVRVLPFPLDLPLILKRALNYMQPDLYVGFEGEFWPNLFRLLAENGVPAVLLNGRLSSRSTRRYRLVQGLFQPVFTQFTWLAMHSWDDRRNIVQLGAPSGRTLVLGSSKYGGLLARAQADRPGFWREILGIADDVPVVVGGSLRGGECTQLLEVFRDLMDQEPAVVGIFAPRHMHNISVMADWLKRHRLPFQMLSDMECGREKREQSVILVNRIGVLFELYSLGDLVFCGGSLEPIGGHNILEPAAWGKAVFYGPHIHRVLDEHKLLTSFEGSFLVENSRMLRDYWRQWVHHLPGLRIHGRRAKEALAGLSQIVDKQVDLIMNVLVERGVCSVMNHAKD